jgi:hypothetical protein
MPLTTPINSDSVIGGAKRSRTAVEGAVYIGVGRQVTQVRLAGADDQLTAVIRVAVARAVTPSVRLRGRG